MSIRKDLATRATVPSYTASRECARYACQDATARTRLAPEAHRGKVWTHRQHGLADRVWSTQPHPDNVAQALRCIRHLDSRTSRAAHWRTKRSHQPQAGAPPRLVRELRRAVDGPRSRAVRGQDSGGRLNA